jgi:GNAT superfamily N-acetyltransferase
MKFIVGWDLEEFMNYRKRVVGTEGEDERRWIEKNPSHLIIWLEEDNIIGHTIWHKSTTKEHSPGDERDQGDREKLEKLLGGERDFVELHEVWLTEENRGKGYGKKFFDFFENFMRNEGFTTAIFYAYNQAALALCRKRGYQEISGYIALGINGKLEEMSIFCIKI